MNQLEVSNHIIMLAAKGHAFDAATHAKQLTDLGAQIAERDKQIAELKEQVEQLGVALAAERQKAAAEVTPA